jgi:Trypsin
VAAALFLVPASQAIIDGRLDGNGHPAVVLVLMEVNGAPAFRCSGTLLSPTIVLTAGHCAGEPDEFSLLLSNNASTGGTCFGDSGGPTSWAIRW